MRNQVYIALSLIVIAFLAPAVQTQSGNNANCTPQERKELVLTVLDKNDAVVAALRAEDLSLRVSASPATILDIALQTGSPLDLAVLIDTSVSQEDALPLAKVAAQRLVKSLLRPGRDRVALVSFSGEPKYDRAFTSDFAAVAAAIDQLILDVPPGYVGGGVVVSASPPSRAVIRKGSTSVWDVIRSATQELFGSNTEKRRRAVILFSDGVDTSSESKLNSAIDEAIKHDVAVFSIGLAGENFSVNTGSLKKLSEQTGGVASFPKKKEIDAALAGIAKRLGGQYVVGYCGTAKDHARIQLTVVNPASREEKLVLAYRRY